MKNLINNQNFLIEDQNEGERVTPCMDVYKAKIQSDRILDKLKLIIVVIRLFSDLKDTFIFFFLVWPPRSQSLLIMGWCSSIPEHRL